MEVRVLIAFAFIVLLGCEQPKCEENPPFYLKDTIHDCKAVDRDDKRDD